jgi:hypothetical protein
MQRVWQIASGDTGRSYVDVFLKHGVGLIGPGDPGPWSDDRSDEDYGNSFVRRFASPGLMKPCDVVLLRSGASVVKAVGIIASDYLYLNQFDDVYGWDLQHARRIRWCPLPGDHDFGQPVFSGRFSEVNGAMLVDYARRFVKSEPTGWQTAALPALPAEQEPLDDIPHNLIGLLGMAQDYASQHLGQRASETEMIAHFVVPFFRALGWHAEQIAVEWRNIDVAIFGGLPRTPENCRLIVEAKYPGAGVEGAIGQARGYATNYAIHRDILVTDGFRYRLFAVDKDYEHVAYANLLRLKRPALELFGRLKRP